ncbi:hypothetical protein SRABI106_03495 [Rahnella aquatilis]|nr:hypothetical protein SRABI106_03495 [Rahnella aquatilis]
MADAVDRMHQGTNFINTLGFSPRAQVTAGILLRNTHDVAQRAADQLARQPDKQCSETCQRQQAHHQEVITRAVDLFHQAVFIGTADHHPMPGRHIRIYHELLMLAGCVSVFTLAFWL